MRQGQLADFEREVLVQSMQLLLKAYCTATTMVVKE